MARAGSWPNRHHRGPVPERGLTATGRDSLGCPGRSTAAVGLGISGRWEVFKRRAPVARLSTSQLCALWRKSLAGLLAAGTPDERAEVVAARGVLLEELERREPQAMVEWLAGGAQEPEGP